MKARKSKVCFRSAFKSIRTSLVLQSQFSFVLEPSRGFSADGLRCKNRIHCGNIEPEGENEGVDCCEIETEPAQAKNEHHIIKNDREMWGAVMGGFTRDSTRTGVGCRMC